ncbi:MAG: sensor histidine kinase [Bdellovibrionota bacterium]
MRLSFDSQGTAFFAICLDVKIRLFHRLLGLVLLTVIPMVIFAAGLVVYLADQRATALEKNVMGTTRALATAVDQNISSVVSSLRILSTSEGFEADSIQFLHKRLRLFVKNQPDWDAISFVDTKGVQIFKTSVPFGRALPRLRKESYFREMMKTGEPVITGFRKGDNVITIAVPVKKNNHIIYALIGSLKLSSFDRFLKSQNLPENWTAAILDHEQNYLGHSRNPVYFTGRKASANLTETTKGKTDSIFTYTNGVGTESFGAMANSRITNWKIFLRIPDDGHLFTSWKTIFYIILGGSLLLTSSIFFALILARNISRPLLSLMKSAKALGKGEKIPDIRTSLPEVIIVNEALKLAAATRDENEKKIQEAVQIRDTFLSVASHELKSPLTTLKLQFQMLERVKSKELERPMQRMQYQVSRLTGLIDDLLDVTRISAGKLNFEPETFDLVTLTQETIQSMEGGNLIEVKAPEILIGYWDRQRTEQVIVNLASNAIKYGNGKPVVLSLDKVNGLALIEVTDQGKGISPEDLGKIFERYERVGTHTGISGLGLGLWIVKKILEGMGGDISVKSIEGQGTTFKVVLPLPAHEFLVLPQSLEKSSQHPL